MIQTPITGQESLSDSSGPYAALVEFYRAFNGRDMEMMNRNWLQSDEASMSNPLGGIKRGWNEIKTVYEKIFNGQAKVYVEFYDYSIHETEGMFIAVGRERGTLDIDGVHLDLAIRTSRTYAYETDAWRQLHHHGSMDDAERLSRYQSAVLG